MKRKIKLAQGALFFMTAWLIDGEPDDIMWADGYKSFECSKIKALDEYTSSVKGKKTKEYSTDKDKFLPAIYWGIPEKFLDNALENPTMSFEEVLNISR
jgi:hypothetical protein